MIYVVRYLLIIFNIKNMNQASVQYFDRELNISTFPPFISLNKSKRAREKERMKERQREKERERIKRINIRAHNQ